MDHADHLRHLDAEAAALLAAVGRAGLADPVPTCPGWTVRDLVDHVSEVYRHKVECVRLGAEPEPWPPERDLSDPVRELREAYAALADELSAHEGGDPAATWHEPDQTVGFWSRRMAHETAVHRADADSASGPVRPVADELAADGVDELLVVFAEGDWSDLRQPGPASTVVLAVPGRAWTVRSTPEELRVAPDEVPDADARVTGSASDVLLWLWGRRGLDGLDVAGDAAAAEALGRRLALVTG